MKILYHHRIASKDGQYVHIEEIINALTAQGHEIVLVAPEITQNSQFGSDGGWVSKLRARLPQPVSELMEFGYSFLTFVKLCRAIIKHKPDGIYERYNLFLPAGIWAKKLFRLKLLLEVNSPLYDERKKYNGIALNRLALWSEHYAWRNADHVLPVTSVLAGYLEKSGVNSKRITVIPNGIDPDRFSATQNNRRSESFKDKLVIGFVGFCREWHRLDEVMQLIAAENNPAITFLIVGDGPVAEQLKQQANELNIQDNFHITGLVERDDMPFWLDQIDIALQPAVTPWASPLKMIEYMATGKAIIAPDSSNICELLEHKNNALLFDENHPEKIINCLKELIDDRQLMKTISENAISTVQSRNLTWRANAAKIVALFD